MYCEECIYINYWNDASFGVNIIAKWDVVSFCQMPPEITTKRYNKKKLRPYLASIYSYEAMYYQNVR